MGSSVTASLCVRPSIFGQYSSRLGFAVLRESATSRPSARDRVASTSASSLLTIMPSGSVMRMGGISSPTRGASMYAARKLKRLGHFFGFLALATLPVYTAVLVTGIGIAQIIVERVVRPVALYFPVAPVGEAHVRASEGPRAFVCILRARRIVPGIQLRIGPRFRKFMSGNVRQSR